jgi:hypothetical protein
MKSSRLAASFLLSSSLGLICATAQAQTLTSEQFRQLLQRQLGGFPAAEQPAPMLVKQNSPAQVSETALAKQLSSWPKTRGPFTVERFRDGFSINGERVLDPEGEITLYSVDSKTGDAAYLMKTQPDQYLIKLMRHRAAAPLTIAVVARQAGSWTVETISGVRVAGNRLNLTSQGFIVARDNALFRYQAGTGLRPFGLPETHMLATHQNGDVSGTGWILLEKRIETKQSEGGILAQGSLGALMGSLKKIGSIVGVNQSASDYALFNLESNKLMPLTISLEDNNANFMSQCRQRNFWISECDRMDTVAALYGQDGYPNRLHYFWRVSWFETELGPVAVLMEHGSRIVAIELNTDRRVTVFERALGIGQWSATQLPDGRIQVKAQVGLDAGLQEDVVQLLGTAQIVQR